jgi:hypothetical protein
MTLGCKKAILVHFYKFGTFNIYYIKYIKHHNTLVKKLLLQGKRKWHDIRLVIKVCSIKMTFSGDIEYYSNCSKLACLIFILFVYKGESPMVLTMAYSSDIK